MIEVQVILPLYLGYDRKAEDSLENTLSCVPKVQGIYAESLRQTDRDAIVKRFFAHF